MNHWLNLDACLLQCQHLEFVKQLLQSLILGFLSLNQDITHVITQIHNDIDYLNHLEFNDK